MKGTGTISDVRVNAEKASLFIELEQVTLWTRILGGGSVLLTEPDRLVGRACRYRGDLGRRAMTAEKPMIFPSFLSALDPDTGEWEEVIGDEW